VQVGSGALPLAAMAALEESGFVVLPGPFPVEQLGAVAYAYDAEVGAAVGDDIHVGSTSTRVVDFVNRGRCSIRCTSIFHCWMPPLSP
jgi:hypothetical protein